ncbi:MAG: hypothetical protein Ct9H300mP27_07570 [Chloroflexota bacterium]|nr:MAG: hypothetical protein Ct9H300mP27_07570 [Chloroflexota bacterium]
MEGYLALSLANVIANEGLHASGVDLGSLFGEESENYLPEFDPDVIGPQIGLPEGDPTREIGSRIFSVT